MMIGVRKRDERVLDLEFLASWHTVTQRRSETYPFYKDFTRYSLHPGVLATKVGYFGSNLLKWA